MPILSVQNKKRAQCSTKLEYTLEYTLKRKESDIKQDLTMVSFFLFEAEPFLCFQNIN